MPSGNSEIMIDPKTETKIVYERSTGDIVFIRRNAERSRLTSSGLATLVSSEARGDILRRGASAWERLGAASSGNVLVGDGTDVASVALTGDVTVTGAGVTAIGASKVLPSMVEADLLRYADVQVTNAQLLALLGTDITLVAAPGANKALLVRSVYLFFDVTTTAYTLGSAALAIGYGSDGADIVAITEAGFLDTVADDGRIYYLGGAVATPTIVIPTANVGVVLRSTVADMTGGNAANTLSVRVYYSVIDTAAFT